MHAMTAAGLVSGVSRKTGRRVVVCSGIVCAVGH
jgi:hypothetical protein